MFVYFCKLSNLVSIAVSISSLLSELLIKSDKDFPSGVTGVVDFKSLKQLDLRSRLDLIIASFKDETDVKVAIEKIKQTRYFLTL